MGKNEMWVNCGEFHNDRTEKPYGYWVSRFRFIITTIEISYLGKQSL